jgi:hypothetical protein
MRACASALAKIAFLQAGNRADLISRAAIFSEDHFVAKQMLIAYSTPMQRENLKGS